MLMRNGTGKTTTLDSIPSNEYRIEEGYGLSRYDDDAPEPNQILAKTDKKVLQVVRDDLKTVVWESLG